MSETKYALMHACVSPVTHSCRSCGWQKVVTWYGVRELGENRMADYPFLMWTCVSEHQAAQE